MKSHWIKKIAMLGVLFCLAINVNGAYYERTKEVIYGRKHGVALTMDVITPAKQNNRGVIFAVSGGWFSSHDNIDKVMDRGTFLELLKRGHTVFAVVHGRQPKFTVPEIREDMYRAVRFIRHHAELYKIDPANIRMFGGSAGGHLTLLQRTDGQDGDPSAEGPVDRESSGVQAIVSHFPPTDFLNYGKEGQHFDKLVRQVMFGRNLFLAALDFRKFDKEKQLIVKVEDQAEVKRLLKEVSPITHVNKGDALPCSSMATRICWCPFGNPSASWANLNRRESRPSCSPCPVKITDGRLSRRRSNALGIGSISIYCEGNKS